MQKTLICQPLWEIFKRLHRKALSYYYSPYRVYACCVLVNENISYIMSFNDDMAWYRPFMDHDTTSIGRKLWFDSKNQQDMFPFSWKNYWLTMIWRKPLSYMILNKKFAKWRSNVEMVEKNLPNTSKKWYISLCGCTKAKHSLNGWFSTPMGSWTHSTLIRCNMRSLHEGVPSTLWCFVTGRLVDGKVAAEMGIVNHCVPQNEAGDGAYQRALLLAQEITPNVSFALLIQWKGFNLEFLV